MKHVFHYLTESAADSSLRYRAIRRFVLGAFIFSGMAALVAGCNSASKASAFSNRKSAAATLNQPLTGGPEAPAESGLLTVPSNTPIHVRLLESITSRTARAGEELPAELSAPMTIAGIQAFPKGAPARCRIVVAHSSGRLHKPGYLRLTLDSVRDADGKWVPMSTTSVTLSGKSHKRRNLTLIGGGSGLGALIGGLAGGGKGAAIGAASGAGAGLAGAYATGKKDVNLPAESQLTFKTVREFAMMKG